MAKILIVDDSPIVRRVMSLTLESEGYVVLTANNGREAIQTLQTQPVDFVFCDYYMPDLDGLSVLEFARKTEALAQLPIVILTGAGEMDDHEKAVAFGANDVLTKPVGSQDVFAVVRKHLAGRPVPAVNGNVSG